MILYVSRNFILYFIFTILLCFFFLQIKGRNITIKYKYEMCDEWLNWIGRRKPNELNIIQCSGNVTLYAISEMFRNIGTNLTVNI